MKFQIVASLFEDLESTSKRLEKIARLKLFLEENINEAPLIFDLISGSYQKQIDKKTIGISLKTIFSVLSFVSKKTDSEIEKRFNRIGDIGALAVEYIKDNKQQNFSSQELTLQTILTTFDVIKKTTGKNSTKTKKELLAKLFISSTSDLENKFLARLLIDDLRIGVSEGVLKESYTRYLFQTIPEENREQYKKELAAVEKKYNVTNSFRKIHKEVEKNKDSIFNAQITLFNPIKSMLGLRSTSVDHSLSVVGDNIMADYKYDGLRVQIHNDKGEVKLFSRNMDEITKQFPEIIEFIRDNFSDLSFVMDSECVGYDFDKEQFLPFQLLSRRILTKEVDTVAHIKVIVRAFDLMYINGETIIDLPYKERREKLESLFVNRPLKQPLSFDPQKISS